jgi:hypothetical protein
MAACVRIAARPAVLTTADRTSCALLVNGIEHQCVGVSIFSAVVTTRPAIVIAERRNASP